MGYDETPRPWEYITDMARHRRNRSAPYREVGVFIEGRCVLVMEWHDDGLYFRRRPALLRISPGDKERVAYHVAAEARISHERAYEQVFQAK